MKTTDCYLPVESTKPSSYSGVGDVDHSVETGGSLETTKLAPLVVACNRHHHTVLVTHAHSSSTSSTVRIKYGTCEQYNVVAEHIILTLHVILCVLYLPNH